MYDVYYFDETINDTYANHVLANMLVSIESAKRKHDALKRDIKAAEHQYNEAILQSQSFWPISMWPEIIGNRSVGTIYLVYENPQTHELESKYCTDVSYDIEYSNGKLVITDHNTGEVPEVFTRCLGFYNVHVYR